MENFEKRIGYSKSAYVLFLKLYCKKNNEKDSNSILSAINAWVTLNDKEKETFTAKFQECKIKYRNQVASRLEKIEPYMKKKAIKRTEAVVPVSQPNVCDVLDNSRSILSEVGVLPMATEDIDDNQQFKDLTTEAVVPVSQPNVCDVLDNSRSILSEVGVLPMATEDIDDNQQFKDLTLESPEILDTEDGNINTKIGQKGVEGYEIPILSEPAPPHVRNAIDLFNIIKNKNGNNDLEWSSLSRVEKLRYRKAVYQLKKDYLKNYKTYLESLPSNELFEYYHRFERPS